jgi:chromosome segregation ATPase
MNSKVSYVLSGIVFLMLVFAASRNDRAEISERLQSNAKTIETLDQRLEDLQQTVSRQSRLINQLRAEPLGQAQAEPAPIDSEELMVSIEPFIEQYLDDRAQLEHDEQREQMEDAMAKSRERRNQQLAK